MFARILAATDRIRVRDTVVLTAARVAALSRAELHVIHVLESEETKNRDFVRHYQTEKAIMTDSAYEAAVKEEIERGYRGLLSEEQDSKIFIATGFPWHEIKRYARKINADLIVMGPHSTRAQEKGVARIAGKIGSSVEQVIKREKCPVMIANDRISSHELNFRCILTGIDFSKSCGCALDFAVKLSRHGRAALNVFHMLPVPPNPRYSQADYEADVESAATRLAKFCRSHLEETEPNYWCWGGVLPHREILKCANKVGADAIVMGSHTKETQGKWYAGNAVERVAFRSGCPVIVITDPSVLKPWEDTEKEG